MINSLKLPDQWLEVPNREPIEMLVVEKVK